MRSDFSYYIFWEGPPQLLLVNKLLLCTQRLALTG
jgi:hypothetical protein